jgi:hypothetical protein
MIGEGVPWVAVRHGNDHVHVAAVLGRFAADARLSNDYYQVGAALAWAEREYVLQVVARHRLPIDYGPSDLALPSKASPLSCLRRNRTKLDSMQMTTESDLASACPAVLLTRDMEDARGKQ